MANQKEVDKLAIYALGRIDAWIENFARSAGVPEAELAHWIYALLSGAREGADHRMSFLSPPPPSGANLRLPTVEVAERPPSQLQSDSEGDEADSYASAPNFLKSRLLLAMVKKMAVNGPVTAAEAHARHPFNTLGAWNRALQRLAKEGKLRRIGYGEYVPSQDKPRSKTKTVTPKLGTKSEWKAEFQAKILKAMEGRERMNLAEIAEAAKTKQHNLYAHLREMIEEGKIEKLERGEYGPVKDPDKAKRRGRPPIGSTKIKIQILEAMQGRQKMTLDELVATSDAKHKHSLYEPLRQLIAEGQLEKIGEGLTGVYGPGKKFNVPGAVA